MRAVLDSNVLISGAITKGPPHRIIQGWLEGGSFHLVICRSLLDEVATVLVERQTMRRWISVEDARLYVVRLSTTADVSEDPRPGPLLTRDPDDDFVVYLARENDADWIVSGDADLLDWPAQRPPVIPPADFERMLRQD